MKILAIGPYLGSFKEEMFTFRPYARWLHECVEWDRIYLSTHKNRVFLYDFIPEENIIPIYSHISRDEKNQKGYIHKDISKKDFKLILKKFKEEIIKRENCTRRDIEIYFLSYTKSTPPISYFNKIFEKIPEDLEVDISEEHKNRIIFIPARTERIERVSYIYNYIKSCYDCLVVGDTDTWFSDDNIVLNQVDYFQNGWKYIVKYISYAKGIICPLSYWTGIANLQGKRVFSWGKYPSQYKEDGIYHFRNKNSYIIPSSDNTDLNIIIKSVDDFLKRR